jgi:hypothetical protein
MDGAHEKDIQNFVGRHEGRRVLGKPKHREGDNIKMGLKEIESYDVDWINLSQNRIHWRALVDTLVNIKAP